MNAGAACIKQWSAQNSGPHKTVARTKWQAVQNRNHGGSDGCTHFSNSRSRMPIK